MMREIGKGRQICIIGGSAAGAAAAARVKRLYPGAKVHLIEQGPYVSYGACELPHYIGGSIKDINDLVLYTPEQLSAEKGITVHSETRVISIDRSRQSLDLDYMGKEFSLPYDKLIIATGASPRAVLENVSQDKVFRLKNIPDGMRIRERLMNEKTPEILILGGGYIAMELIENMRHLAKKNNCS